MVVEELAMTARNAKVTLRSRNGAAKRSTIARIIELEKEVWKVAQDRDAARFKELVPSDALMIFQSGVVTQPEYLATMKQRTILRYELRNVRGFMPTATTAVLYYEAERIGQESGEHFPSCTVIESTTWVKRGRRWVAVLNQETPIRSS
jgi:hypothetical protein